MKITKMTLALIVLISVTACQNDSKESKETKRKTEKETQKFPKQSKYELNTLKKYESAEALKKEFGSQVESLKEWREEGAVKCAISYIQIEESAKIKIVWKDTEAFTGIQEITLFGTKSKFKTSNGLSLGMSLTEIEKLNGEPFQFYGFAWDNSGAVVFETGNLKSDQEQIYLHYPMEELPKEFHSLMGDHLISSTKPLAQKLNPFVCEIIIK